MKVKALTKSQKTRLGEREQLRERYRPRHVRILFVGEAPPASGRFFYQGDSGLYRAIRYAFEKALPRVHDRGFLEAFQGLGCYLVDLCGRPVDRLGRAGRTRVCAAGEARLSKIVRELRPEITVTLLKSIQKHVERVLAEAKWSGIHVVLPYPGRWHQHREEFTRRLVPILRRTLGRDVRSDFT
jgi:hypothetical protein